MQKTLPLKRIIQTALLIAITLILRNFSYMVFFGGNAGMRIGISRFFSKLPALLFGPIYGGLTDGIIDILGYFIKPDGAYIPLLTLTAALGGVLVGLMWKGAKKINTKLFRNIFLVIFALFLIFGIANYILSSSYPDLSYSKWLLKSEGKKLPFFTIAPIITAVLGLFIFTLDALHRKKFQAQENFIKLFTVLFTANILVTTINTLILMFVYGYGKNGFLFFYIPRFVEECIMTTLQSYVVSYLLQIYKKYNLGK